MTQLLKAEKTIFSRCGPGLSLNQEVEFHAHFISMKQG